MSELHLEILRQPQKVFYDVLQQNATLISTSGFYLAGGTALALAIGHRESQDFDFFSRKKNIESIRTWIEGMPNAVLRDTNDLTIHADIADVKVSFIAGYRYPLVLPLVSVGNLEMADILDIGLMKMLAITHRATLRDYLDLAVILRDHCTLQELLEKSAVKYGPTFNVMLCLRAMTHFDDLDQETPLILDPSLKASWQEIIQNAVKEIITKK